MADDEKKKYVAIVWGRASFLKNVWHLGLYVYMSMHLRPHFVARCERKLTWYLYTFFFCIFYVHSADHVDCSLCALFRKHCSTWLRELGMGRFQKFHLKIKKYLITSSVSLCSFFWVKKGAGDYPKNFIPMPLIFTLGKE